MRSVENALSNVEDLWIIQTAKREVLTELNQNYKVSECVLTSIVFLLVEILTCLQ